MELTPTTTEEALAAPIVAARAALAAKAADPDVPSTTLLAYVHDVWAQEAIGRLRYQVVGCLQHYPEGPERSAALNRLYVDVLSNGADDGWSGRNNDAKRVAFDEVRQVVKDLRWSLR